MMSLNPTKSSHQINLPPPLSIPAKTESRPLPSVPGKDVHEMSSRGIAHYTPEKIEEILKELAECRVNATLLGKSLDDQGRISRCVEKIQVRDWSASN